MNIRTKLLVTYLLLVAVVGLMAAALVPRWVKTTVIQVEQARLRTQMQTTGERLAHRLARLQRSPDAGLAYFRESLERLEDFLPGEVVAIANPDGTIVMSSHRSLVGRQVPRAMLPQNGRRSITSGSFDLDGEGTFLLAATPIPARGRALQGYSLLLVRHTADLDALARPIIRRVNLVVALLAIIALLVSGWVSRDLIRRLRTTGEAARALADGDLSSRAPEEGQDEITELAGHFNHMAGRIQALVEGLRRSEQARKDLLVMVSHELRTPITSIGGFAEALRDGVVRSEEQKQRYYQILADETERLARLVHDLFDMAKLEAGQVDLNLQLQPITPWLVDFAERFQPVAEGAGARLDLQISPEAERARAHFDRDRMDQVLTNLASNALRYTPEGESVTIRAEVDGDDVVIAVSDRGPGIPPEEQERLFERFFQGAAPARRKHKGAGLGLAIVKSLVEAHGGTVGVRSTPGHGATFWFRLRVAV